MRTPSAQKLQKGLDVDFLVGALEKRKFELVQECPWGFNVPELSWSNCNSYFQPLFCEFSEQLSLVPLPLENQVCAGVVLRMLRYSQWVKKGASFHPARAPRWLNAEREELLGSCYSCYAMYMGRE